MADDKNSAVSLLPSAARAATVNTARQSGAQWNGVHVVVHCSTASSTGISLVPKVQGQVPGSTSLWYDVLVGTAITSTGTTVLKVYPGIAASAGAAASDLLPPAWRVSMVHGTTKSATYTVGAYRFD